MYWVESDGGHCPDGSVVIHQWNAWSIKNQASQHPSVWEFICDTIFLFMNHDQRNTLIVSVLLIEVIGERAIKSAQINGVVCKLLHTHTDSVQHIALSNHTILSLHLSDSAGIRMKALTEKSNRLFPSTDVLSLMEYIESVVWTLLIWKHLVYCMWSKWVSTEVTAIWW